MSYKAPDEDNHCWITIIVLVLILLILLAPVKESKAKGLTIATGSDILYSNGTEYSEIRYNFNNIPLGIYIGTQNTYGIELNRRFMGFLDIGLGVEIANKDKAVVSTTGAYQIRIDLPIDDGIYLSLKHRSNCKTLCSGELLKWIPHGDEDTVNHGFNYLMIRYEF